MRKDDGSRATGTILDPKGKAIEAIRKGEGFYGEADILGKTYMTGYEPIRSAENNIIGIYYVGYVRVSNGSARRQRKPSGHRAAAR